MAGQAAAVWRRLAASTAFISPAIIGSYDVRGKKKKAPKWGPQEKLGN
jgi:hypothetical protein